MNQSICLLGIGLAVTGLAQDPVFYPVETDRPGQWFLRSIESGRKKYEKYYLERLDKLAPAEERSAYAAAYFRMLDELAVSNREEDAAIEKALQWRPGDFTYHNDKFYRRTGCTSWMVAPDASVTGAFMVQKTRDYTGQNLLSIRLFRSMPGRYKIITVGDLWSSGAGAVMNEKGLMIVQNDGPGWEPCTRKVNTGCVFLLRYLAERCANVAEAEAELRRLYAAGIIRSADLYIIGDLNRGFVIETTARSVASAPVDFGFEVRANTFQLPGMSSRSKDFRKQEVYLNGENRRFAAGEFLGGRLREKGLLSPLDLMACSRLRDPEMEKKNWRQVCMKNTIASTLMVPDRSYPDVLSAVFISLGPTRSTVYLPVPMGVTEFPEELANGDMGLLAFAVREKYGLDHSRLPQYNALEKELMDEFFAARDQARILLRQSKREEARKLLTELFRKQFLRVRAFLKQELDAK